PGGGHHRPVGRRPDRAADHPGSSAEAGPGQAEQPQEAAAPGAASSIAGSDGETAAQPVETGGPGEPPQGAPVPDGTLLSALPVLVAAAPPVPGAPGELPIGPDSGGTPELRWGAG